MWKNYSKSYIKNNPHSSTSVIAAALIATLSLSLLCSLAYNFWIYEIEAIVLEEGDWQGRILGGIDDQDLPILQNFSNVKKVVVKESASEKESPVTDIYFQDPRRIYRDMPLIAKQLGKKEDSIQYHSLLLSRYLIHDPQDENPPLLLTFYLGILLLVALSLILIIHNSFEISMDARIHQFGIFSSIGATPRQIRICLLQEALALSGLPIIVGSLAGTALGYLLLKVVDIYAQDVAGRHEAVFHYHPLLLAFTLLISTLTVLFSAWIPAKRLSRITPLEAIRNTSSPQLEKQNHPRILSLFFGVEGELAGNALKARKRSLRISSVSLLFSFLGFSIMLVFTTLSRISTRYTYFERYQDSWDVMVTVKDAEISDLDLTDRLQAVPQAEDVIIYQKAEATGLLPEDQQSAELTALGGADAVAGAAYKKGMFQVKIPIVVLDDASFLDYCTQIGTVPSLDGAIVLDQIWDSINSNFREKKYIPFVKEDGKATLLLDPSQDGQTLQIPVLSYTQTVPILREEYDGHALVHFISSSMWRETARSVANAEPDSYIRILSTENASLLDLDRLEKETASAVGQEYDVQSENRIREKISNDRMFTGMMMIFGAFCALLAVIGIAHVFSDTLGFLRLRKREFAQYMSIGLTPEGMRKIFYIEAFVIAGKPLLLTFLLTALSAQLMVTASYLEPMVFWSEAPVIPILVFAAAIVFFVALAYHIGGKRLLQCDLNEILRNDTLM